MLRDDVGLRRNLGWVAALTPAAAADARRELSAGRQGSSTRACFANLAGIGKLGGGSGIAISLRRSMRLLRGMNEG